MININKSKYAVFIGLIGMGSGWLFTARGASESGSRQRCKSFGVSAVDARCREVEKGLEQAARSLDACWEAGKLDVFEKHLSEVNLNNKFDVLYRCIKLFFLKNNFAGAMHVCRRASLLSTELLHAYADQPQIKDLFVAKKNEMDLLFHELINREFRALVSRNLSDQRKVTHMLEAFIAVRSENFKCNISVYRAMGSLHHHNKRYIESMHVLHEALTVYRRLSIEERKKHFSCYQNLKQDIDQSSCQLTPDELKNNRTIQLLREIERDFLPKETEQEILENTLYENAMDELDIFREKMQSGTAEFEHLNHVRELLQEFIQCSSEDNMNLCDVYQSMGYLCSLNKQYGKALRYTSGALCLYRTGTRTHDQNYLNELIEECDWYRKQMENSFSFARLIFLKFVRDPKKSTKKIHVLTKLLIECLELDYDNHTENLFLSMALANIYYNNKEYTHVYTYCDKFLHHYARCPDEVREQSKNCLKWVMKCKKICEKRRAKGLSAWYAIEKK